MKINILCKLDNHDIWFEIKNRIKKISGDISLYISLFENKKSKPVKKSIIDNYPNSIVLISNPNKIYVSLIQKWLKEPDGDLLLFLNTPADPSCRQELISPIMDDFNYVLSLFNDATVGMIGSKNFLIENRFIKNAVFCVRNNIFLDYFKYNKFDIEDNKMEMLFGDIVLQSNYKIAPAYYAKNIFKYFDEDYYLKNNLDVLNQVKIGIFNSGFSHFMSHGRFESRRMNSMTFDEDYYRKNNPDVSNDFYHHFLIHGYLEGRNFSFK